MLETQETYMIVLPKNKQDIVASSEDTWFTILQKHLPNALHTALAVKIQDQVYDLSRNVHCSGELSLVTFEQDEGKEVFWHSSAHVLAQAIKRLFNDVQLTLGPVTRKGPGFFYYDIYLEHKLQESDLEKIENEMNQVREENHTVERMTYSRKELISLFRNMGEFFKVKIIESIDSNEELTVYKQGEFQDLCRGPHVISTKKLGIFKLTALSGAYWKGDPSQPMLQRIYGISFPEKKQLKQHLALIEESEKRDHRKLGKELDLFYFSEDAPGMPFYLPNGTILFNLLTQYIRKQCVLRGYQEIITPIILSDQLWIQSGHYDNFKENMYFTQVDDREFAIKPMNCPGANIIYQSKQHSYRELPIKFSELGRVHRHEISGVLHGLFRVRSFTQDDAHIYCMPEQLEQEICEMIQFAQIVYQDFGFHTISIFLATRPEKSMGSEQLWEEAISVLKNALVSQDVSYDVKEGEGAFYGPKIELNIQDALGRDWQCGTIQVDFSMPERFNLHYISHTNEKQRPVMVHRAILGSIERFLGILIEHYAGKFPFWLSPVQISILTINPAQNGYANIVYQKFEKVDLRVHLDIREEKINYKIREWNHKKINYAIILGKNEEQETSVSIRARGEQVTNSMLLSEALCFFTELQGESCHS